MKNKKVVLITGGGSGVGKSVAKLLQEEKIILIDKNEQTLRATANEMNCEYYVCDVSIVEELNKTMEEIKDKNPRIDVLINCAGLWTKGELSKQQEGHFAEINSLDRIKHIIDTNTFGTIAMIKMVVPIMQKQGYGQIININSQSGVVIEEFCPVYNASKHGGRAFSQAVLTDLAKSNIRLTDVCPGLIKTEFYRNANDELPQGVMNTGLEATDVANIVKYILELPENITIPSIEIKNIKNY